MRLSEAMRRQLFIHACVDTSDVLLDVELYPYEMRSARAIERRGLVTITEQRCGAHVQYTQHLTDAGREVLEEMTK